MCSLQSQLSGALTGDLLTAREAKAEDFLSSRLAGCGELCRHAFLIVQLSVPDASVSSSDFP